jgi:integrase
VLAVIDRQSATGKRDYAMILTTARLGLRISDLRHLELGDLDWRAKRITIVQHKMGRPLSLPLLDDVGWAIIDYVRGGRPETACPKVFVKHRHPFDAFGGASSVASRLSRHAARAGITFPPGQVRGMHSLRGALAVAMIGNGTPMPVVSAVLGHASSDTTQAYYQYPPRPERASHRADRAARHRSQPLPATCPRSSRRCDYADNPSPLTTKTTDSGSRRRIIGTAALCSMSKRAR